jgi:hypothetical protein
MPTVWIAVADQLPPPRPRTRQVITCAVKTYTPHRDGSPGNYPGEGIKAIQQDWVVWNWPQNFTHWAELPTFT